MEQDDIEAEQLKFYAFDFESAFEYDESTKLNKHTVNFVHVKRCFTDQQHSFNTITDFLNWVYKFDEPACLYAHNMKGYDGRLIYEEMQKRNLRVD